MNKEGKYDEIYNSYDLYLDIKERIESIPQNDPVLPHYLYLARNEMVLINKNDNVYSLYTLLCLSIQQKMGQK